MYSTYKMFNVCDLCDIFHYFLLIGKCHQGLLVRKMPCLVTGNRKSLKGTYMIDTTQKRNSLFCSEFAVQPQWVLFAFS